MPFMPKCIDDEDLEILNEMSASAASYDELYEVNPNSLNALVCEIQAWRRRFPHLGFMSGPNELEIVDHPPAVRSDV